VHISTVMPDFTLLDINIHRFEERSLASAIHAKRATREGNEWQLEDVELTRFDQFAPTTERIDKISWQQLARRNIVTSGEKVEENDIPSLVSADVLKSLSISPESLSAQNLYDQVRYLNENQLDSKRIELAFWTKVTSPLATLVMLMLSMPFVFASQRAGGAGQKIFIGIMLGIAYVLVNKLLTQLGLANGLSPLISALLPLLVFLLIAIWGILRTT